MTLPTGWRWSEQRVGRFEAVRELPDKTLVHCTSTGPSASAAKVEAQATTWNADQDDFPTGGALTRPAATVITGPV